MKYISALFKALFYWIYLKVTPWEYGSCLGLNARRHKRTGIVQYVLSNTGNNYKWMDIDSISYKYFKKN